MPRNRNAKPGVTKTPDKFRQLRDVLGEQESDDDDESFKTLITDESVDYKLTYSLGSTRNTPQSARNTSRTHTRNNPLPTPSHREDGPSTSFAQQNSRKSTGSARRKARTPKKRTNHIFKEIRRLQKSTELLIPRLPFTRLIREILQMFTYEGIKVTPTALEALQEATEIYITQLLSDSYRCTLHRDRVTLQVKDVELARYLRGRDDPGNY